ncbi:helix-turn-helix domain-containing protein [Streptomyces sp. NPDC017260]|uniref:nSTAND1 domain-containing NTPase n=1 Tax=unclassified Streptomyces TaxID=2593676 RepID=UPI0037A492F9
MGRREKKLDPASGPVQAFAHELRQLRSSAGSPPYRELAGQVGFSAPTLSEAAAGRRLPSLQVALAYATACGGEAATWERRWRSAQAEAARETVDEQDTATSPYRGLRRYETSDQALFFGRDTLVQELRALTTVHRFVALVGASGSGKSSILRAGLIPALRDPEAPGPAPAVIRICTPGSDPDSTLIPLLAPADAAGDTLLIIDQFEELFTLQDDRSLQNRLIDRLLTACTTDRLRVLIAVRADFFGHCAGHPGLACVINQTHLLTAAMTRTQLRAAVTQPAAAAGLVVERTLTDRILADVATEPGSLPLMSHALLEVWRRRSGKTLTLAAYEAIDGVHGAIAHTAEAVFADLSETEADLARTMLLRLISPSHDGADTRRPVSRSEFVADERRTAVFERLVAARLLAVDADTVELAHEALITAWPRLHHWVTSERDRLHEHRRLTEAASTWEALDRDGGALYRGVLLVVAREYFLAAGGQPVDELNNSEKAFLLASVHAHEAERKEATRAARRVQLLSFLLVVLTTSALAVWLTWFLNREHP